MNCPLDGELLQMSERSGVEIDYCPRCRGVWLDRGELDKILERAERELPSVPYRDDDRGDKQGRPFKKKKKNFLSEMLEFGD